MSIIVDNRFSPIVMATAKGEISDAEQIEHLAEVKRKTIDTGKTYAYIYDGTGVTKMAASTRKLQADWIAQHSAKIAELAAGCAFVFTGFTRPMLTAILFLSPPVYPHKVTGDRREAIEWAIHQIRKVGLPYVYSASHLMDANRPLIAEPQTISSIGYHHV